jgi:hypothetical protein
MTGTAGQQALLMTTDGGAEDGLNISVQAQDVSRPMDGPSRVRRTTGSGCAHAANVIAATTMRSSCQAYGNV